MATLHLAGSPSMCPLRVVLEKALSLPPPLAHRLLSLGRGAARGPGYQPLRPHLLMRVPASHSVRGRHRTVGTRGHDKKYSCCSVIPDGSVLIEEAHPTLAGSPTPRVTGAPIGMRSVPLSRELPTVMERLTASRPTQPSPGGTRSLRTTRSPYGL